MTRTAMLIAFAVVFAALAGYFVLADTLLRLDGIARWLATAASGLIGGLTALLALRR